MPHSDLGKPVSLDYLVSAGVVSQQHYLVLIKTSHSDLVKKGKLVGQCINARPDTGVLVFL
jgi:hypothetical protein